jgi:VWFA-related protein
MHAHRAECIVVWSVLCCFSPSAIAFQQSSEPKSIPKIKVSSRLVVVDVVATDSRGDFPPNLSRSDFRVFEDGKEQEITSFELRGPTKVAFTDSKAASANLSPAEASQADPKVVPIRSASETINIVLLDSLNTEMPHQGQARKELLKLLKALPRGQPMAVFVLGSRLHMLKGPTGNTDELIAAVDKILLSKSALLVTPDDKEREEDELLRMEATGFNSARLRQFLAESTAALVDMRVEATCDALRQIARSMARYPGRKNLVWLSGAFPFAVQPDSRLLNPWGVQRNYAPLVRETSDVLARGNISVYPIDVRGLVSTTLPASASGLLGTREGEVMVEARRLAINDPQSTMKEIAEQTGGRAFYNSNDLRGAITSALQTGSSYYTLSYVPPSRTANGDFHRVKVQIVSGKRLRLEYRRGYYASATSAILTESQLARELDLAEDRESPLSTELNLTASTQSANDGTVTIRYSVGGGQLSYRDEHGLPQELVLVVAVAGRDKHGKSSGGVMRRVRIPASAQSAAEIDRQGVNLVLDAKLSPSTSQVRLGVVDQRTGLIGTVDIEVPSHVQ